MTMRLVFLVQGSSLEPYRCEFHRDGEHLRATCSCAAGEALQACKHRLALLAGDPAAIASENAAELELLKPMLLGSTLQDAIEDLAFAESELASAKKKVSAFKNKISRLMHTRDA